MACNVNRLKDWRPKPLEHRSLRAVCFGQGPNIFLNKLTYAVRH